MASEAREGNGINVPLVVVLALLPILGLGWWWFSNHPNEPPQPPPLTAEAKKYVQFLKLSGVHMQANASYSGAMLVEITGRITNTGTRSLDRVELNCGFYDRHGILVLRERVPIVRSQLKTGETREFRLPFENPPEGWNRTLPQLVIAHIDFAG